MDGLLAPKPRDVGVYAAVQFAGSNLLGNRPQSGSLLTEEPAVIDFDFKDVYKTFAVSSKEVFERVEQALAGQAPIQRSFEVEKIQSPSMFADKVVETIAQSIGNSSQQDDAARKEALERARVAVSDGFRAAETKLTGLGAFQSAEDREVFESTRVETEDKVARFIENA